VRTSGLGHERRFHDVRDESALPPTPERLRHRSEPTLRARSGPFRASERVAARLVNCTDPRCRVAGPVSAGESAAPQW
jgi:hypothetical protein